MVNNKKGFNLTLDSSPYLQMQIVERVTLERAIRTKSNIGSAQANFLLIKKWDIFKFESSFFFNY